MAKRPAWQAWPVTAWFTEAGQEFAAFTTVQFTQEDADALPVWQRAMRLALMAEDAPQLALLCARTPGGSEPRELYFVQHHGPVALFSVITWGDQPVVRACSICDWQGRLLPEEFDISTRHWFAYATAVCT